MSEATTYVFIDFDDTLSDMRKLRPQYVAELAHLLAADHGGDEATWASTLPGVLDAGLLRYAERFVGNPDGDYSAWLEEERAQAGREAFEAAGVPLPDDEPIGEIAKRLQFDALTACDAAFDGAADSLRELFEMGVRTQMASSQESEYLFAALIGAQLESYTESKFGPDLVNCAKEGPGFYRRIFEACGIRPSQAVVVDDQAMCLDWAEEAGARVVQACLLPDSPSPEFPVVMRHLVELPGIVRKEMGAGK